MNIRTSIILSLFIFSTLMLNGQKLQPTLSIDKDSILIGDQVKLNIFVNSPPDAMIAWPRFEELLMPKVEILNQSSIDTLEIEDARLRLHQQLLITSFDTGIYIIPPLKFTYQNKGEETFLLDSTNSLQLYVLTVKVDTTQAIMPIKGPISSPYTWGEIAPWLILGIIIIGLVIFLIYYFKKKKNNEPIFKAVSKPKIPAHIVALNGLDNLKSKKLWHDGKFKEYYTEMIDIIRVYLVGTYDVDAMEMTSDEINQAIKNINGIAAIQKEKLSEALLLADLAKFAKEQPLPLLNDNNLSNMVEFVHNTHNTLVLEEKIKSNKTDKAEDIENQKSLAESGKSVMENK
ncbi:MAG: hypothetical protein GY834_15415 [Bacteroidetes bacterium]|nr:hypothetical protein [Bacteroidota bacterium]